MRRMHREAEVGRIKAVLFDLDGTLVHSEAVAIRSAQGVFERYGVRLDSAQAEAVTGKTWSAAMEEIERRVALPIPRDRLLGEILQDYRARMQSEVHPVPGCREAVEHFSLALRMGVVSGSYREEIESALQKLGIRRHFDPVLGAEDYIESKPSPEGYLKALSILGLQSSEVVIFEDSEPGVRSGLAAGCRVVLVRHCGSIRSDSPWIDKVHATIETFEGMTLEWLETIRS